MRFSDYSTKTEEEEEEEMALINKPIKSRRVPLEQRTTECVKIKWKN